MEEDKDKPDNNEVPDDHSRGNGPDSGEIHIEVLDLDETGSTEVEPVVQVDTRVFEQQINDLRKEKDELYDRLLRKQADFENFRKRAEKDKRDFKVFAFSEMIYELLPVLDNFERALAHAEEQSGPEYRKGVELIYRQFRDALEKKGLKPIETKEQPFDPNLHEAIVREEHAELEENTILEEFQKGYFFRERLLRPALVKVSHRPAEPAETNKETPPEGQSDAPDDGNGE